VLDAFDPNARTLVNRYAHCILGILNYPMALFCAVPMAHFARVVPFGTTTVAKNVWSGLWLVASSPLALLALLSWSRIGTAWLVDFGRLALD
jgi:hypothetical protein